jgi:hypothetical protein
LATTIVAPLEYCGHLHVCHCEGIDLEDMKTPRECLLILEWASLSAIPEGCKGVFQSRSVGVSENSCLFRYRNAMFGYRARCQDWLTESWASATLTRVNYTFLNTIIMVEFFSETHEGQLDGIGVGGAVE